MKRPKDILSQPYHIQEYINYLESKNSSSHSVCNSVRQEVERRRDLIINEPDGIVRETMISNLAIDL